MKRLIALVGSVLAFFVAAAGPVAAAPSAPSSTVAASSAANGSVPPSALGLGIANLKDNNLAVSLDPGGSQQYDVVLSNHSSNLRLSVRLTATDAGGALGAGAAQWLSFGSDVVSLDPGAVVTVPMTVAIPHATPPESVLAHLVASVETATAAADGSPRTGTAKQTMPVSISVQGSPTAQIAIADVHRNDQGGTHQLALVLRNFSDQDVLVNGTVKVLTTTPQNLRFKQSLAPERDTTLLLDWNAPPEGTGVDVAVDAHYGASDVATWSSTLGGPPTTLVPNQTGLDSSTGTTVPGDTSQATNTARASVPGKPWYDGKLIPFLIVLALLAAGAWFFWEFRRSKERVSDPNYGQPFFMVGNAGSPDATAELAKQLVRLTEIIVELTTNRTADPGAARAPNAPVVWKDARAGPAPPGAGSPPDSDPALRESITPRPDDAVTTDPAMTFRSAALPPDVSARPEPEPEPDPEPDPQAEIMKRLVALDEDRKRLRAWMDETDDIDDGWPGPSEVEAFRAPAQADEEDKS